MSKRIEQQINSFKYKGEPIRITLGTLIMTALCVLLIIVATFTQITLYHPYLPLDTINFLSQEVNNSEIIQHFMTSYKYIPQTPIIFFIVALIGRKFGILSILSYIILGFFFPIFALGGGLSYLLEYGFGYILAFIPTIFFVGTLLKDKVGFFKLLLIVILGVLTIHILGILYMFFIATLRQAPMDLVLSWVASQSGVQIFYDIFFSLIAIYLGKQVRRLLWLIMC